MKLLIFIHSLSSGGAERVASSFANYWVERGWDVTIVTITSREHDFYLLHPEVRRTALELESNSSSALAALYHNFRRVFALRRVLFQEKPDVALGMMATASILLALAAKGTGIPAIGGERTYPPMLPLGRIWEFLRRKSYAHLSAVVAQTETTSRWLQDNVDLAKVVVIPNPVSYPLIAHEPKVSPETGKLEGSCRHVLLAVGRLGFEKQFDRLLNAFAELAPRLSDWCLVIVGEGTERPALEKQVVSLGLEGRVKLPGVVGNISEWYKAADLYVMTSRFEGFPNTLLEAMSHGVAAVSVDCETGPREILRHEIDGLLIPQDDPHALVLALARLMTNEPLRYRYAARAAEVRDRFSLTRVAGQWEELFAAVQK